MKLGQYIDFKIESTSMDGLLKIHTVVKPELLVVMLSLLIMLLQFQTFILFVAILLFSEKLLLFVTNAWKTAFLSSVIIFDCWNIQTLHLHRFSFQ